MFNVKDTVVYGASGVCEICELREMKVGGRTATYYVLQPVNSVGSMVFVPMDNPTLTDRMKKVMSKAEICDLLRDSTPYLDWVEERKQRAEKYSAVISGGDKRELLCMLRMLYEEKLRVESQGKKQYITDKRLMTIAEKIVGDEFSYVMDLPREGVARYIYEQMAAN